MGQLSVAELIALIEGGIAILVAIVAIVITVYLSRRTDKLIQSEDAKVKSMLAEWRKEHEESERRHKEMLERMDRRHEETMNRIAQLITAKSEEIKELIKT